MKFKIFTIAVFCFLSFCSLNSRSQAAAQQTGDFSTAVENVAKIVKNKVAAPFRDAEIEIFFDEGISRTSDIMDLGVKSEVIQKMGSWFSFENEKLGQGREGVKKYLQENPKILNRIEKLILTKYETAKK